MHVLKKANSTWIVQVEFSAFCEKYHWCM